MRGGKNERNKGMNKQINKAEENDLQNDEEKY